MWAVFVSQTVDVQLTPNTISCYRARTRTKTRTRTRTRQRPKAGLLDMSRTRGGKSACTCWTEWPGSDPPCARCVPRAPRVRRVLRGSRFIHSFTFSLLSPLICSGFFSNKKRFVALNSHNSTVQTVKSKDPDLRLSSCFSVRWHF